MFAGQVVDFISTLASPFPDTHTVVVLNTTSEFVAGNVGSDREGKTDRSLRPVPLSELYVHHYVTDLLNGAGAEGIRTPQLVFPKPYYIFHHPSEKNTWTNFHLINTLGVKQADLLPCVECWCDNVTMTSNGDNGGIDCCSNCPTTVDTNEIVTYYLKYNIAYRKPVAEDKPVLMYTLNAAHNTEYDVPKSSNGQDHILEKVATIDYAAPQKEGLKMLGCFGHQHIGGKGLFVMDEQTGKTLCESIPTYGQSLNKLGDEKGYLTKMSYQFFDQPRYLAHKHPVKIRSRYDATVQHTGVMGLVFILREGERSQIPPDPIVNGPRVELGLCKKASEQTSPVTMLHATRRLRHSVSLFWLEVCGASYTVRYKAAKQKSPTKWKIAEKVNDEPRVTVKNLRKNTKYVFEVTAVSLSRKSLPAYLHVMTKR
jgi:hypothetical protein